MTPVEQAAVSASLDAAIGALLGWAIVVYAVWYFARKWLKLPSIVAIVQRIVSTFFAPPLADITSSPRPSEPSEPAVLRTDAPSPAPEPAIFAPTYAQIFDGCKLMRGYGLTREQARDVVKAFGGAFPNDLWTQVAPAPTEGQTITPIAGRATKAKFEYDDPALNYVEPRV